MFSSRVGSTALRVLCGSSRSASSSSIHSKDGLTIGEKVAANFSRDPRATAESIAQSLQPADRSRLLVHLTECVFRSGHGHVTADSSNTVPASAVLFSVALSAGLPFVMFGFSDNAIMILAGDEIETTFGGRLGLSTLAAAGLGNLLSDLVGLAMAEPIQARVGRWMGHQSLSTTQRQMWQTRAARLSGTSLGVTVGCLLGMTPLFFLKPKTHGQVARTQSLENVQ